ncbi:MAG: hypothetical protein J6W64_02405, partial [Bacilli bacterium]|nr:hypothetical protein [Bacilli bacterium]
KTDTLELVAGSNITITSDTTNDKVTISATGNRSFYGTCTNQAANQFKTVVISSEQNFALATGVIIAIKFDENNTFSATSETPIKLNVNNTGDKQIYAANSSTPTGTNTTYFGRADYINYYMYDGTYWVWAGSSADNNTTYSAMSTAELTTGTATNSRVVRSDYLKAGIESIAESSAIDTANNTVAFTQASTRANIATGESHSTIFGKIKKYFADLKTVAFSGSYNDLSDQPTIPTVNNATLTIQKNGTNVQTFTANASSNKTANITVPTKTSEITNDSNFITPTDVTTGSSWGSLSVDGTDKVVKLEAIVASAGTDLNDYTTPGVYTFSSSVTPTNIPVGANGMLIVLRESTAIKQIWVRYGTVNSNDHQIYIRTYWGGDWSNWHRVMTQEGGTFTGNVNVNTSEGTTTTIGSSIITVGNNTVSGSDGNSRGFLRLYANNNRYIQMYCDLALGANRDVKFQDKAGTIAYLEDIPANVNAKRAFYCTCDSAADASNKVVSCADSNFVLETGTIIVVTFDETNTASDVTLNVNSGGSKAVRVNNATYTGSSSSYCGYASRQIVYMYDGTGWAYIGKSWDSNTTYTNASLGQGYGTCSTAAATTAKAVTLSSYALTTGGIVAVKFTYTVPANATLNINSKGAKNIYYRGSAITANIILAGDIGIFIYDGTQYHLIGIDREATQHEVFSSSEPASSLQATNDYWMQSYT